MHGEIIRTNNDIEGWHAAIARTVRKHSDIYSFLAFLQDKESISHHFISHLDAGRKVKRPNRKYDNANNRILSLTMEYVKKLRTKFEFLKGCSMNLCDISNHKIKLDEQDQNIIFENFPEITPLIFDNKFVNCENTEKVQIINSFLPADVEIVNVSCISDMIFETLSAAMQIYICMQLGLQIITVYSDIPVSKLRNINSPPNKIIPVRGDGACFFRSISFLLTGSETHHISLRNLLCNYIESVHDIMGIPLNYIQLSNMRSPITWATENEILALASFLHCNIYVYSSVGKIDRSSRWLKYSPNDRHPSPFSHLPIYSLFLNHMGEIHFEPVLDIA